MSTLEALQDLIPEVEILNIIRRRMTPKINSFDIIFRLDGRKYKARWELAKDLSLDSFLDVVVDCIRTDLQEGVANEER